jgi:hypothetical protein
MALLQQLPEIENAKVVGFIGGTGRNYFVNQIASELVHQQKKVVITHLVKDILAPSGHIIFDPDEKKLFGKIEKAVTKHPVIYAGSNLDDHFVTGVHRPFISDLVNSKKIDFILLIMGNENETSLFSKTELTSICKISILDQLIYCFQLDLIDQPITTQHAHKPQDIFKNFPKYRHEKVFTQDFIFDYLTSPGIGALSLFKQKWPVFLIFTDINNIFLENRCINIARDLSSRGISHILQANLKENLVKRIFPK